MSDINTNDTSEQQEEIVRLLRSHRISPTSQRVKIATTLLTRPQHLSADQVLALANQQGRRVSKATVYNTLGLFARKGLIRELIVDSGRAFYDSSTHAHFHFYNPETQQLHDVEDGQFQFSAPEKLPPGTTIDRVEVVVHLKSVAPD